MAERSNDKQQERRSKSDQNMNRAIALLIGGMIAEWYLLMADRYYVRGGSRRMYEWYRYFGVMRWVGLGLLIVGVVLLVMKNRQGLKNWIGRLGAGIAAAGGFLALSSEGARHVYPTSVSVMCVLVPVVLVLGIIYLFYQAEFSVQATALAAGLFALALLNRSGTTLVRAVSVLVMIFIALLIAGTVLLKKNGGTLKLGQKPMRLFPVNMDYRLTFGVPALCIVAVLAALLAPSVAFYAIWVLGALAFALAVYYTVKLM